MCRNSSCFRLPPLPLFTKTRQLQPRKEVSPLQPNQKKSGCGSHAIEPPPSSSQKLDVTNGDSGADKSPFFAGEKRKPGPKSQQSDGLKHQMERLRHTNWKSGETKVVYKRRHRCAHRRENKARRETERDNSCGVGRWASSVKMALQLSSFRVCETGFVINLPLVLSSGPSKYLQIFFFFPLFFSSLFFPFFIWVELELGGGRGTHEKNK